MASSSESCNVVFGLTWAGFCLNIFQIFTTVGNKVFKFLFLYSFREKKGRKFATAEEVLVAKGETLVANATDTVAMSSPDSFFLIVSAELEQRGKRLIIL